MLDFLERHWAFLVIFIVLASFVIYSFNKDRKEEEKKEQEKKKAQ